MTCVNWPVRPRRAEIDPRGPLEDGIRSLLRNVSGHEPVTASDGAGLRLRSRLVFADGVGHAEVRGVMFPSGGGLRLDLWIEHDRAIANPDGTPTATGCFLNDFSASTRLPADAETLPDTFVKVVMAGVSGARDAVERYNARLRLPWFKIHVAVLPLTRSGARAVVPLLHRPTVVEA